MKIFYVQVESVPELQKIEADICEEVDNCLVIIKDKKVVGRFNLNEVKKWWTPAVESN